MSRKRTRTIRKGRHHSFPILQRLPWGVEIRVYQDNQEDWQYVHSDDDQWDWNKLIGVKLSLLVPRCNSLMVGWRYVPDLNIVQFAPYWHLEDGEAKQIWEAGDILNVQIDDLTFPVDVVRIHFAQGSKPNEAYVNIMAGGKSRTWSINASVLLLSSEYNWVIAPWFGGQKKATKTHKFHIEW